jgi:hypothetical protein
MYPGCPHPRLLYTGGPHPRLEFVHLVRAASCSLLMHSQEWLCHRWHRHSCLCLFASPENVETRAAGVTTRVFEIKLWE